jgi:hypothetical protein
MTINAALNLAFPIRWKDVARPSKDDPAKTETVRAPAVWAYHTPIAREVFEANYRVIAAVKAALFSRGAGYAAEIGPRIATLALRDAAKEDALETGVGEDDGTIPLLAEIKRLTMVLAPSAAGYDLLPVDVALARNAIDVEDWSEAESAVVFFTCGYTMAPRVTRDKTRDALALALRGSITSLPPTEYAASLPTSTTPETSEPAAPSSLPS